MTEVRKKKPDPALKPTRRPPSQTNRSNKRAGKNPMSQDARRAKYRAEIEELGIQTPMNRQMTHAESQTLRQLRAMLKMTWSQLVSTALNFSRFSEKQVNFYREYARNGRQLKREAMVRAGYTGQHTGNLTRMAEVNLRLPYADDLVRAFELEEKARMGLRIEDVANWFENIAKAAMEAGDFSNANRAMEQYGKYLGMFVERKEITHRTIQSKEELDARIAELKAVLSDEKPTIERNLTIN